MGDSPLQTEFTGGEISPRLGGRFDSPLYKKALKQCSDFEPLAQGSLRMRAGTVKEIKSTGDTRIRLLRLRVSNGDDYLLELLDKSMNVYLLNGTQLQPGQGGTGQGGQIDVVKNGNFTGPDGNNWQQRAFGGGRAGVFFTDPTRPDPNTGLPSQLGYAQLVNDTAAVGLLYQKVVIPFDSQVTFSASLLFPFANDLQFKISTTDPAVWANADAGGEVYITDWDLIADNINPAPPFTAVNKGPINLAAGVYYISFQVEQRTAGKEAYVDNVVLLAKYAIGGGVAHSSIDTPWFASEVADLQFDTETGRDRTIFTHDQHAPWFLEYGGVIGAWSTGNVVFSPIPKDWGDTGSSNVDAGWDWQGVGGVLAAPNWPKCVQVYQGRIYYAGEPAQKNRVLASKVNDPDNMAIGSNPGDALDFKIATKGAIRWLAAFRKLLAWTDQGGYEITGSTGIPLVGDVQVPGPQSGLQAASIQPVIAGTKAVFVSSDLRRIRATTFDFQTQGWESKDVTFAAEHLTAGLIKELHQGYTPDGILIGVLKNGNLIACTFDAQEQIEAWWTINVGAPVCSACIAQGEIGAYLWLAVNRNGGIYIERLPLSESGEETLNYVDAGIAVVATAYVPADQGEGWRVTGLDHLAGLNVRVIDQTLGGVYVGDFGVGLDGEIRIELQPGETGRAGNTLVIGVKYVATAITMPKNSKSGKVTSSKLGVILNNSRQPLIGTKTLKRASERTPATIANVVEPLFTGKKIVANAGWSDNDSVTIQQDQPFRTEVCALFSVTEMNES